MTALLMAICINDMNSKETAALTDPIYFSSKYLTFKGPQFVDEHSTGGVGDKTSFTIAPITSLDGIKVPVTQLKRLQLIGGTATFLILPPFPRNELIFFFKISNSIIYSF